MLDCCSSALQPSYYSILTFCDSVKIKKTESCSIVLLLHSSCHSWSECIYVEGVSDDSICIFSHLTFPTEKDDSYEKRIIQESGD